MCELPSERLPFELDDRIDPRLVTAHAGVPPVIERFRRVVAAQVVNTQVRLTQRQRGLTVLGSKKWTPSTYDLRSGGVGWNICRDSSIRRNSGNKRCSWSWNRR